MLPGNLSFADLLPTCSELFILLLKTYLLWWLKTLGNPTQWTRKVDIRREEFFIMLGYEIVSSILSSLVSSTLLLSTSAFGEKSIRSWFDSQKRKRRVRKSKSNEQFHPIHRRISFELINAVCKRRQLELSLFGGKFSKSSDPFLSNYNFNPYSELSPIKALERWPVAKF